MSFRSFSHRCVVTSVLGLIAGFGGTFVVAAPPAKLVVTELQDEPRRLPKDNVALFSATNPEIEFELAYLASIRAPDSLAGMKVSVVTPDGQTIALEPSADGTVRITNIIEGMHAIIAQSPQAIASIAFYAQAAAGDVEAALTRGDRTIDVPLMSRGRRANNELVEQYATVGDPGSVAPIQFDFQTNPRFDYTVRLTADGALLGTVISTADDNERPELVANTNLSLLKNGQRIRSTVCDELGRFQFSDVAPGVYGMVAVGPAGYSAFAFEAYAAAELVQGKLGASGFVSRAVQDAGGEMPVVMIPPPLLPQVVELLREFEENEEEMAEMEPVSPSSPFAGGSSGGGFGGGGGGGGLGGLAALAAIGAVLAGNNDDNAPPVFASPSVPN